MFEFQKQYATPISAKDHVMWHTFRHSIMTNSRPMSGSGSRSDRILTVAANLGQLF